MDVPNDPDALLPQVSGTMSAAQMAEWSGGRYTVKRELGQARVGEDYLAFDSERQIDVLLTVIPSFDANARKRFELEIRHLRRLDHPGIQPLFELGSGDSFVYHTGPYIAGETLRQRLMRDRQLPVVEAFGIARDVALALAHAHGKHIVHRDLVPGVIYLANGPTLRRTADSR